MKQLALSYYSNPDLILIPMAIFITFFIVLLYSVLRKSNNELYDYLSKLPLDKEDNNNEQ